MSDTKIPKGFIPMPDQIPHGFYPVGDTFDPSAAGQARLRAQVANPPTDIAGVLAPILGKLEASLRAPGATGTPSMGEVASAPLNLWENIAARGLNSLNAAAGPGWDTTASRDENGNIHIEKGSDKRFVLNTREAVPLQMSPKPQAYQPGVSQIVLNPNTGMDPVVKGLVEGLGTPGGLASFLVPEGKASTAILGSYVLPMLQEAVQNPESIKDQLGPVLGMLLGHTLGKGKSAETLGKPPEADIGNLRNITPEDQGPNLNPTLQGIDPNINPNVDLGGLRNITPEKPQLQSWTPYNAAADAGNFRDVVPPRLQIPEGFVPMPEEMAVPSAPTPTSNLRLLPDVAKQRGPVPSPEPARIIPTPARPRELSPQQIEPTEKPEAAPSTEGTMPVDTGTSQPAVPTQEQIPSVPEYPLTSKIGTPGNWVDSAGHEWNLPESGEAKYVGKADVSSVDMPETEYLFSGIGRTPEERERDKIAVPVTTHNERDYGPIYGEMGREAVQTMGSITPAIRTANGEIHTADNRSGHHGTIPAKGVRGYILADGSFVSLLAVARLQLSGELAKIKPLHPKSGIMQQQGQQVTPSSAQGVMYSPGLPAMDPHNLEPVLKLGPNDIRSGPSHDDIYLSIPKDQRAKHYAAFMNDANHMFRDKTTGDLLTRGEAAGKLNLSKPLHSKELNEMKSRVAKSVPVAPTAPTAPPKPVHDPALVYMPTKDVRERYPMQYEKFTDLNTGQISLKKLQDYVIAHPEGTSITNRALFEHLSKSASAPEHPLRGLTWLNEQRDFRGRYHRDEYRIEIAGKRRVGKETFNSGLYVINHELLHNSISSKFKKAPQELIDRAQKLYDYVRHEVWNNRNAFPPNAIHDYGFSNLAEFFSEVANSKFRDILRRVDYKEENLKTGGKRNITAYQKVLDFIMEILRMPKTLFDSVTGKTVDTWTALHEAFSQMEEFEAVDRKQPTSGLPPVPTVKPLRNAPATYNPLMEKGQMDYLHAGIKLGDIKDFIGKAGQAVFKQVKDSLNENFEAIKPLGEIMNSKTMESFYKARAGYDFPKTETANPAVAHKLVGVAQATAASHDIAKSLVADALGDLKDNMQAKLQLGGLIYEDMRMAQADANPNQPAGNPVWMLRNSPFDSEAQFLAASNNADLAAAILRWKDTVQKRAEAQHFNLGGQAAPRGKYTESFMNLKDFVVRDAAGNLVPGHPGGGGSPSGATGTLAGGSKFSKPRKFAGTEYNFDVEKIGMNMVQKNYTESMKRDLYRELGTSGLGVMLKRGQAIPEGFIAYPVNIRSLVVTKPGKAPEWVNLDKRIAVSKEIAAEFEAAFDLNSKPVMNGGIWLRNMLTQAQIQLGVDAGIHTANDLRALNGMLRTKFSKNILGLRELDTLVRFSKAAKRNIEGDADFLRSIKDMAEAGVTLREGVTKSGTLSGKVLRFVDTTSRLAANTLFDEMVKEKMVADNSAERRRFINGAMGQYNARMRTGLLKTLQQFGFSPFVVAGETFNRLDQGRVTFSPGVKGIDPKAELKMRAYGLAGFIISSLAIPAVVNTVISGNPMGRPGTKIGEMNLPGGYNWDVMEMIGYRRGARTLGLEAVMEGEQTGETVGQMALSGGKDILQGIAHPLEGPAVRAIEDVYGSVVKERKMPKFSTVAGDINPTLGAMSKASEMGTTKGKSVLKMAGQLIGIKVAPSEKAVLMTEARNVNARHNVPHKPPFEAEYLGMINSIKNGNLDQANKQYQELIASKGADTVRGYMQNFPTRHYTAKKQFDSELEKKYPDLYQRVRAEDQDIADKFFEMTDQGRKVKKFRRPSLKDLIKARSEDEN